MMKHLIDRPNENPNIPAAESIWLDAFNILPGAAFMVVDEPDPRVWVVEKVVRDFNFERVYIWAHDGTDAESEFQSGLSRERAFDFDYMHKVALVGMVVNFTDPDDNNFGTN